MLPVSQLPYSGVVKGCNIGRDGVLRHRCKSFCPTRDQQPSALQLTLQMLGLLLTHALHLNRIERR